MITPCILVCTLDDRTGLCSGCARSLDEIGGWAGFTPDKRQQIMAALPARLAGLAQAAGVPSIGGVQSNGRDGQAS